MNRLIFTLLGFLVFRLPGAILGFAFGYWLDKQRANRHRARLEAIQAVAGMGAGGFSAASDDPRQAAFFKAVFVTLGRLCKADGQVSQAEIQGVEQLMLTLRLSDARRGEAIRHFSLGKNLSDSEFREVIEAFGGTFSSNQVLLEMFFKILLDVAVVDGEYHQAEREVLIEVTGYLNQPIGFLNRIEERHAQQRAFFEQMRHHAEQMFGGFQQGHHQRQGHQWQQASVNPQAEYQKACEVLGVSPDEELPAMKKAYRRLMSQHHPDKLVSKGLPPEMIEVAKQKTQEIQAAWDLIQKHRQ